MIEIAKEKRALYFGFGGGGHGLRSWPRGADCFSEHPTGFPWDDGVLDTGLLRNRGVPDRPDGRVYWTGGGKPLWLAFFWWDRSGDPRGACNSGFYVQGFSHTESQAALDYACAQWPLVVARQPRPRAPRGTVAAGRARGRACPPRRSGTLGRRSGRRACGPDFRRPSFGRVGAPLRPVSSRWAPRTTAGARRRRPTQRTRCRRRGSRPLPRCRNCSPWRGRRSQARPGQAGARERRA